MLYLVEYSLKNTIKKMIVIFLKKWLLFLYFKEAELFKAFIYLYKLQLA